VTSLQASLSRSGVMRALLDQAMLIVVGSVLLLGRIVMYYGSGKNYAGGGVLLSPYTNNRYYC
jgi:hypothetical protein